MTLPARFNGMASLLAASIATAVHLPVAAASLPAGISGSWYNPEQSGHGLSVEILDQQRALGYWYVYDPDGNPIHLYLDGTIEQTSIISDAYYSSGMRFGSFDPLDHQLGLWGTVTLTFSDCDSATLQWNAHGEAGAGFGVGETSLTRLSAIAGLPCSLDQADEPGRLPSGSYRGTWDRVSGSPFPRPWELKVAVDNEGNLWATADWTISSSYVSVHTPPPVFFGHSAAVDGNQIELQVDVLVNSAIQQFVDYGTGITVPVTFNVGSAGDAVAAAATSHRPNLVESFAFSRPGNVDDPLRRAIALDSLAGQEFAFSARGQFFEQSGRVRFLDEGRVCIQIPVSSANCRFSGMVTGVAQGLAMFDIELEDARVEGVTLVGKGWFSANGTDQGESLVLVVREPDGHRALGIVGSQD